MTAYFHWLTVVLYLVTTFPNEILFFFSPVAIFSSERPVASNGYDSCVIFRLDVRVSCFRVLEDRIWKAKNVTVSKHTLLDPLAIHHNVARMFIYTMLTILTCFPVGHFGGLKMHQYPPPPHKDDLVCYPRQLWNFVVKVSNSVKSFRHDGLQSAANILKSK